MTRESRVLLLEDDPAWVEQFRSMLPTPPYAICVAETVEDATRLLADQSFDAVLLDLRLRDWEEDFSGMSFLDVLDRAYPRPSVVIVSAYGQPEHVRVAFKQFGVTDFIDKRKLDVSEFRAAVEDAVSRHRAQSARHLEPDEKREFNVLTRKFFSGEPVVFEVPEDAVNPWERDTDLTEED